MAFSNALSGRMEELRFPILRQNDNDNTFTATSHAAKRESNPFYSTLGPSIPDVRGSLQRRFTTDSSKLAKHRTSFGQQYPPTSAAAQLEQKQIIEDIQIARRKAQEQLALLDEKERRLQLSSTAQDTDRFAGNFNRMSLNGPVSEPTTPPEYADDVFSNRYSRGNRISMSNITSPPGLSKRTSQTSSKITSPPGNRASTSALYSTNRQSTKSMPGSRRGSDEEEEDYVESLPANRSAAALNRFSMPVSSSRHNTMTNIRRNAPVNTNDVGPIYSDEALNNAYSALTGGVEDSFPTLSRDGVRLSANYAAAEIASSAVPEEAEFMYESRPRPGHASMPHNDSSMYRPVLSGSGTSSENNSEYGRNKAQRHSSGISYDEKIGFNSTSGMLTGRPNVLQSSFSSNDVPTVKKSFGVESTQVLPHSSHAEAQFHAHNVSMGRIPFGAISNRQSRDVSNINLNSMLSRQDDRGLVQSPGSQTSIAPFTPGFTTAAESTSSILGSPSEMYAVQPMYPFNMSNFTTAPANNSGNSNSTTSPINSTASFAAISPPQTFGRQDARAGRRGQEVARLDNVPLEACRGNLYNMSKDQHGCRYMQRKLEDSAPGHVEIIFNETCPHIIELMTDPFGNYLCQKLFEHCNDEQRTQLIIAASPALPAVALNQHGTRALQKMIEHLHTSQQVDLIIQALSDKVVDLVQDLNGNHVIQKCLQVLGAERCQFIYDRVGQRCVVVGTHRHGCCVLQRCIDHAQGYQRAQLVAQITRCAFDLVQDAYGNYVVQYILDLDEINYTRPLCQSFRGKIAPLSKQKFSSNVIEKCIRVADHETKNMMIEEMLGVELERLLRDSFGNYVVQTALDYSDPGMKQRMIDLITPILPAIKQTPHGRRVASKIQGQQPPMSDNTFGGRTSNRRQVQINGGGFVYGGRGFPMQQFAAEEYSSGQPGVIHPMGYTPAQNGFPQGYNSGVGVGNYI